ncbi:MAG: hypothetical protein B7733_13495 [Myxococcales bacterium FL481]|nr:MAG: hypothetical protein B7733_13495 [Myxococcales bacterium FL481]
MLRSPRPRHRSGPLPRFTRGVAAALVGLSLAGCATYSDRTARARDAVTRGDFGRGATELNKLLDVDSSEQLPDVWKKETALTVLERGTVHRALRRYEDSARDFEAAEKELELLDIAADTGGKIGRYIYSDSATKYHSSPTEKLSLNGLNLLNYLSRGDLAGARVEAKRFTVMRRYFDDYQPDEAHVGFGSYMAGFVYEKLGETDGALRYYDEALAERDLQSLAEPIARLSAKSNYRSERLTGFLERAGDVDPVEGAGEILCVVSLGRVPYKVPERLPIGAAIGVADAHFTGDPTLLEYGAFKVVVYPEMVAAPTVFDEAAVTIDGTSVPIELTTDLGAEIRREYDDLKPRIIGAALTRMVARAAAAEGARAAGRQSKSGGDALGLLAALAVEGTMVALDKPDTRSWTLLPGRILVSRVPVPPGKHTVEVTVRGPGGRETHRSEVDVSAGGFAVVDVTTLR